MTASTQMLHKRATGVLPSAVVDVDASSSFALLLRAREGDEAARNELCARYLPRLRRWAHGRLPVWAREHLDTEDIVQDALMKSVRPARVVHAGSRRRVLRLRLPGAAQPAARRAAPRRAPAARLPLAARRAGPRSVAARAGRRTAAAHPIRRRAAAAARIRPRAGDCARRARARLRGDRRSLRQAVARRGSGRRQPGARAPRRRDGP